MGKKKGKSEEVNEVTEELVEEEEYEVEKVLDKKVVGGKVHYLLKWKNYPESDSTWEAQEGLQCPELIEEFENTLKEKKKAKSLKRKDSASRYCKSMSGILSFVSKNYCFVSLIYFVVSCKSKPNFNAFSLSIMITTY